MKNFKLYLLTALVIFALLFAACDDDGDMEQPTTPAGQETTIDTVTEPVTEAHVHVYGEWEITMLPTCTEDGSQERVCACGEKDIKVIPAKGHTDGEWITDREANCTEDGNKHQVCAVCKATIQTETIPHVGHDNVLGKCPKCNCILEEYNSLFVFEIISDYHSFCYDDNQKLTIGTYYIKAFLSNDYYETLAIPSEYNGIPVTAINSSLLSNKNVECLIIPDTITCVGTNLCGSSCSCPLLKRIICLPKQPFTLGSYALDPSQLAGGCKIYVPSSSESLYKESHSIYSNLITSIDELDESLINKIKFRYGL